MFQLPCNLLCPSPVLISNSSVWEADFLLSLCICLCPFIPLTYRLNILFSCFYGNFFTSFKTWEKDLFPQRSHQGTDSTFLSLLKGSSLISIVTVIASVSKTRQETGPAKFFTVSVEHGYWCLSSERNEWLATSGCKPVPGLFFPTFSCYLYKLSETKLIVQLCEDLRSIF